MEQSNSKGLRDAANRIKEKISGWAESARRVVSNIATRVSSLWTRAHEGVYATGQTRDRQDNWYMWRLGATEKHCKDCLNFNGQIHTATEWANAGVRPQDPSLQCGGWNCDCRFELVPGYEGTGVGNIGFGE
jgi:hypothetical protein